MTLLHPGFRTIQLPDGHRIDVPFFKAPPNVAGRTKGAVEFYKRLQDLVKCFPPDSPQILLVDLCDCKQFDKASLGALVAIARTLRNTEGIVVLDTIPSNVKRLIWEAHYQEEFGFATNDRVTFVPSFWKKVA